MAISDLLRYTVRANNVNIIRFRGLRGDNGLGPLFPLDTNNDKFTINDAINMGFVLRCNQITYNIYVHS
jgi:hypothetical protein